MILISSLLSGCDQFPGQLAGSDTTEVVNTPDAPTLERQAFLTDIVENMLLPDHLAFMEQTIELEVAAEIFGESPTIANLENLQSAWIETTIYWKAINLFSFQDATPRLLYSSIEKHPANIISIEDFISTQDDISVEFIDKVPSTSKGFPAIEYLIFPEDGNNQTIIDQMNDIDRKDYLISLIGHLSFQAENLYLYYSPSGENYSAVIIESSSDGSDPEGSVSLLTNFIIERIEDVRLMQIGKPLGKDNDGVPDPTSVIYYLSGHSLDFAIENMKSIRKIFLSGFNDYLDSFEDQTDQEFLSQKIDTLITDILDDLEAIDIPLQQAVVETPDDVEIVYQGLSDLYILFKVDMAYRFGLTIIFGAGDGD